MAVLIRLAAGALVAATPACDWFQDADPLALDADRVVMLALAEADSSTVAVIVGYPHRQMGNGPVMDVRGTVSGSATVGIQETCDSALSELSGVYSCYRISVSRSLVPGDTLELVAENSNVRLAGSTVIPQRPEVIDPPADPVLSMAPNGIAALPVIVFAPDAGAVLPMVGPPRVTVDGQVRSDCRFVFTQFNGTLVDTIKLGAMFCPPRGVPDWDEITFDVRWLASDTAYANYFRFVDGEILRQPWPKLGMVEGVGMVGSRSASRPLSVTVRR